MAVRRNRRFGAAVALAAAAVAAAAVTAALHGRGASARPPAARPLPGNVAFSTPVQPSQLGSSQAVIAFAGKATSPLPPLRVFRRAAGRPDRLPPGSALATMAASMPSAPAAALPDLRRARLLLAADGVELYAAPSRDGRAVCVELDPGDGAACQSAFLGGLMPRVETSVHRLHGRAYGVADDSVARVEVALSDGRRLRALLRRNGFYVSLPLAPAPRSLLVTHRDGAAEVLHVRPMRVPSR